MTMTPPRTLVEDRVAAFQRGDFGFIYDSYHPRAPFLEQFPDRSAYLDFANDHIAPDCSIEKCKILSQEVSGEEARVIFHQLLRTESGFQESFEMAHLLDRHGQWFYLGSERIERSDFRGKPEDLQAADFAAVADRVFF